MKRTRLFLLSLLIFILLPVWGWGATYSKLITLTGTGSDETNYIVPLNIHYGSQTGDVTTTDIFLDSKSRTDFGDIRFYDPTSGSLSYYQASYGNYEIIKDQSKLGTKNIILSDGSILSVQLDEKGQGIWLSANNGTSYNNVYNTTEAGMVFVDSQGNIFASSSLTTATGGHTLLKNAYTDTAHTTWTAVLDVSATSASDITIFPGRAQTGLVAHWKLNEGTGTAITDSSGNSRAGVLTSGTGSWNSSVEGRRAGAVYPGTTQTGTSYHFNGDGYIEITGSDTDAGLQFTKNFTYIAWIRTTDNSSTLRQIVGKNGLAIPDPIGLYCRTNGTLAFYYGNGSGYLSKNSTLQIRNAYDGGWHMVAVVVSNDATPTVFFTIDGQSDSPQTLSYVPTNGTSGKYRIGANKDNNQYFIGDIDDVQIYNIALTAIQLRQIYEDRAFGATEPGVSSVGAYQYWSSGSGFNMLFGIGF